MKDLHDLRPLNSWFGFLALGIIFGTGLGFAISDVYAAAQGSFGFEQEFFEMTLVAMSTSGFIGLVVGLIFDLKMKSSLTRARVVRWLWICLICVFVFYLLVRPAFEGLR